MAPVASKDRQTHMSEAQAAFEAGAEAWDAYGRAPRGRMRESLILHHLHDHLPTCDPPLRVLDAGAGTGSYTLPLAQAGHEVTLVDYAPSMLELARRRFAAAGDEVLARARFHGMPFDALPAEVLAGRFDVLLVHTVLEYTPHPWKVLSELLTLIAPEGLVSLVIVNRHADALRLGGPRQDPVGALSAMQGAAPPPDLFAAGRQLLCLADACQAFDQEGIDIIAHYGIRIFADHYASEALAQPDVYDALFALELAAGGRDPFRQIGRYHHLVGRRS